MQLNNRSHAGHFLKDHHFYAQVGNIWDNLARASDKTFHWYHKAELELNRKVEAELQNHQNQIESQGNSEMREKIEKRKVEDLKATFERKLERTLLQERSLQPLDRKIEPFVETVKQSLDQQGKDSLTIKRSGVKATLAGGGTSKNAWNDYSRMSMKASKLNFPDKVIQKDEEAARMIFQRIKKDENKEQLELKRKWDKIKQLKEEESRLKSIKSAAAYTRPATALTQSLYKSSRPMSPSKVSHTLDNASDAEPPVGLRERPVHSAQTFQIKKLPHHQLVTDRLASAMTSSHHLRSSQVNAYNENNIPLQKFSEFNGLFISKLNNLNIQASSLPYSTVLFAKSKLVQNNIGQQTQEIRGMNRRAVSTAVLKRVRDPHRKAPKFPAEDPDIGMLRMDSPNEVQREIDDFEDRFDSAALDMREKFYRKFPAQQVQEVQRDLQAVVEQFDKQQADKVRNWKLDKLAADSCKDLELRRTPLRYIQSHEKLLKEQRAQSALALKSQKLTQSAVAESSK